MNNTDSHTIFAYIDECNVPAVLCNMDDDIVYMNSLAKMLMKVEISLPCSEEEFEKACGFTQKTNDTYYEDTDNSYDYLLFRTKDDIEEKYNRYRYQLKKQSAIEKCIYYYKKADAAEIIPFTPCISMEDICSTQELKRFHDTICSQINILIHDVRTAVSLTSLNMQLLSELLDETKNVNDRNDPKRHSELHIKVNEYINAALEGCYIQSEYVVALTQLIEKEQGQMYIMKTDYDVVESLCRLVNFFKHYARRNEVKLYWEGDTTPCIINSDKVRISEAVSSIVQNAIKYTACKESGEKEVAISIKPTKHNVKIIVRDTGIGISKDDIKNINKKYFRAKRAKEIEPYGMGIGLFSAYNNIATIGGEVECISELDHGSVFEIKIPRGQI